MIWLRWRAFHSHLRFPLHDCFGIKGVQHQVIWEQFFIGQDWYTCIAEENFGGRILSPGPSCITLREAKFCISLGVEFFYFWRLKTFPLAGWEHISMEVELLWIEGQSCLSFPDFSKAEFCFKEGRIEQPRRRRKLISQGAEIISLLRAAPITGEKVIASATFSLPLFSRRPRSWLSPVGQIVALSLLGQNHLLRPH